MDSKPCFLLYNILYFVNREKCCGSPAYEWHLWKLRKCTTLKLADCCNWCFDLCYSMIGSAMTRTAANALSQFCLTGCRGTLCTSYSQFFQISPYSNVFPDSRPAFYMETYTLCTAFLLFQNQSNPILSFSLWFGAWSHKSSTCSIENCSTS